MSINLRMRQWMETIFINVRYVLIGRIYYVTLPVFCMLFPKIYNKHLMQPLYSDSF